MKMVDGAACLALANRSRTPEAPTPTTASMKLRGGDREERGVRLTGHGASEQRLAGSRGARQQHPVRHAAAEAPAALRVAR
jgi:hypothetical protein